MSRAQEAHATTPTSQGSTTSPTPEAVAPPLRARLAAEVFGTFVLVLLGCGTAVLAGDDVGFLGVALAFGIAVLAAAYAVGGVSGGHFNATAVSVGLAVARRFAWRDVPGHVVAQVVGGTLAAAVLHVVASGRDGFATADGFATNGYGDLSPAGYTLLAGAVVEVVLTALFVTVILGVPTGGRPPASPPWRSAWR